MGITCGLCLYWPYGVNSSSPVGIVYATPSNTWLYGRYDNFRDITIGTVRVKARKEEQVMKRAITLIAILITTQNLIAEPIDVSSMLGESWYGVYMNNQKAGFAVNSLVQNDDGTIVVTEDSKFQIVMAAQKQDMKITSRRTYSRDGELMTIESTVVDPAGTNTFVGTVQGEFLELTSVVGGVSASATFPKPKESLRDAIKLAELVLNDPKEGKSQSFSVFEPLYRQEMAGTSTIVGKEEREFDGVMTTVYKVSTTMPDMGVNSLSYVAEDGTTLEDQVAGGLVTMRLEPEHLAKDVDYSNDVIVSNAAMVETPISNPRKRKSLRLEIRGPIDGGHVFNDERQAVTEADGFYLFEGKRYNLKSFKPATIPIADEAVSPWIKATQFVQSDNPKVIAKAKEIIGDETDALEISRLLCDWVHDNMRSTFSARLTNAIEVLEHLEGDCTEHSILFIALARASGLPAREVAGLVYVSGSAPGFYFHQWAKVWVGKWIDVDPTFDQPLADVTHIKLAEGDLFEQAKIMPIIGRLKINEAVAEKAANE